MVNRPIIKRLFTPRFLANNNPPPIVMTHAGHIIYDKIYQYKLQSKTKMKPCLLFLSCKNIKEADKISGQLLKEKLVICAKKISINSSYLWNKKIESAQEVLLIMDSVEENFEKINKEVKKLHSYKTYTLFMININKANKETVAWFKKEIIHTTASVG